MNLDVDITDLRTRAAVWFVWSRLPWTAREQLAGVTVKAIPAGDGRIADAGRRDILLRLPLPPWKAHQVICHELAHVAARHYDRMTRGEITRAQAEAEADRLAASWGFPR
jgi:hypothetical protein